MGYYEYYTVCPTCGQVMPTREYYLKHLEIEHGWTPTPEEPYPPTTPIVSPPSPRACIIATVFLGPNHPLLPPMRKFRDAFIPKRIMDIYYNVSVYILRNFFQLECPM